MAKGKNRKQRDDNSSTNSGNVKSKPSGNKDEEDNSSHKQNRRSSSSNSCSGTGKASSNNQLNDIGNKTQQTRIPIATNPNRPVQRRSFYQWCLRERQGIIWVLGCAYLGSLLGFGIGTGILTGERGKPPNAWRVALGEKIRATATFQALTLKVMPWEPFVRVWRDMNFILDLYNPRGEDMIDAFDLIDSTVVQNDPSHPRVFAVLREAIIRENRGYVHPDLGPLVPAPCGAARGLGMVRDGYHRCQVQCNPGIASEKLRAKKNNETFTKQETGHSQQQKYMQEEVLLRIPLGFQMTRTVALDTLLPRISAEVQRKASIHELDDAALLVLLLAHERGVGRYSRWLPYIASLPSEPSCGYSKNLRPYMLDSINAMRDELGLDVNGWPSELLKASQYAERIATGLAQDYGPFIQHPKGMSAQENFQWALCQVASRATGGSQRHGSLRLVPVLDMINHDANAGGFVELTGKERLENGDFIDTTEEDSGTFVVRSLRHGRRKALKKGQELLANYNVPHYSPLDWFVSLGFVPPERWSRWQKIDAALPRIRRDGPFAEDVVSSNQLWQDYSTE